MSDNCILVLELCTNAAGHLVCPQEDKRHSRTFHRCQQRAFPLCGRRRPEVPAAEVVPVLRSGDVHPLPGVLQRVRPAPVGGQHDQPSHRILRHLREHRQPQVLHQHLCHPLPQQVGLTRGEDQTRQHQGLLPQFPGGPSQPRKRPELHQEHVCCQTQRGEQSALPLFHDRCGHRKHQEGVLRCQGHDSSKECRSTDAILVLSFCTIHL